MGKKDGKPKGKMSAYAAFVQVCRDEQKKKNPSEAIVLADFGKKCGEKWKAMTAKDKKRFDDLAAKDKVRYEKEMANYHPESGDEKGGKRKKKDKDPNAPKRALSAFFCFCGEERAKVKAKHPNFTIGEIGKELGKRWEACTNRARFEAMASKDKERYAKELAVYKKSGGSPSKAAASRGPPAKKSKQAAPPSDDEDEDDDDDDDESD